MRTIGLLMVAMVAVVFAPSHVMAVPVDCATLTTVQDHIDANAGGGCFHDTKIFNNFTYSGGGVTAANILVTHSSSHPNPTTDAHAILFNPNETNWTANFTLGYSIAIAAGNPLHSITGGTMQPNTDSASASGQSIVAEKRCGASGPTACTTTGFSGDLLDTFFGGGPNPGFGDSGFWGGVQSVFNVISTSGISSSAILRTYEESFVQTIGSEIPEPATLLLLGGGLAGLGLMRRRQAGPKS